MEVNWNGDGSTFVDEINNVLKLRWRRGREYSSAVTGKIQTGSLTAVLRNADQRYSPFNASSPIYGNVLPTRKVRVKVDAAIKWSGFLDEIIPDSAIRGKDSYVELKASGPLRWVADRESNTELFTSILAGTAIGKILDDAGWPAGDRTLDAGQVTMVQWKADSSDDVNIARLDTKKALQHLQEIEESEIGLVGEDKAGKVIFEDAHHRHLSPHTVSQATFSDASGAAIPYDGIEELDHWRLIYNRAIADVYTFKTLGSSTLWSLTGETPVINPGVTKTFVAIYPQPGSSSASDAVASWGVVSLLANGAANGSGLDLTGSIAVGQTKRANTQEIALTNNASVAAFITQLLALGTPSRRNDPTRVIVSDATSQTKYGRRTWPLGGKFYPTSARARDFCEFVVSRFKDPQPILKFWYQANDPIADHMTQAKDRDVSDRITVVANGTTPSGAQLGINADFFIESELHEYDLSEHIVTYLLSYAGDATHGGDGVYWNLGVALLATSTRLDV